MIYLLAYKDKNGNDCKGLPWLHLISRNTLRSGKIMEKEFSKLYNSVVLFCCQDDELPEEVSWDFVNKHKIK